jgi:hypothetical protein
MLKRVWIELSEKVSCCKIKHEQNDTLYVCDNGRQSMGIGINPEIAQLIINQLTDYLKHKITIE